MPEKRTYYLATIGQYTKELTVYGLTHNEWDFAYLFPSEATRDTAFEIKNYFANQRYTSERINIKEVDPYNFWKCLADILEVIYYNILTKNTVNSIVVDISGGTRIMSIALHYAGTFVNAKIIYYLEDKSGERKKLTLPPLKRIKYSPQDALILKILYEHEVIQSQRDLKAEIESYLRDKQYSAKTKGLSRPQISRRLKALVDMGIVERLYLRGREIKLTEYGKAYMRYLELSKKIMGLKSHERS